MEVISRFASTERKEKCVSYYTRSGVLRTQKLKTHLFGTQGSKVFPFGVGQNIAMHASSTARDFFFELISTFPVHSLESVVPKNSSEFFLD